MAQSVNFQSGTYHVWSLWLVNSCMDKLQQGLKSQAVNATLVTGHTCLSFLSAFPPTPPTSLSSSQGAAPIHSCSRLCTRNFPDP